MKLVALLCPILYVVNEGMKSSLRLVEDAMDEGLSLEQWMKTLQEKVETRSSCTVM